jgi:hypothetical protein
MIELLCGGLVGGEAVGMVVFISQNAEKNDEVQGLVVSTAAYQWLLGF